jgi:hypothetical protein
LLILIIRRGLFANFDYSAGIANFDYSAGIVANFDSSAWLRWAGPGISIPGFN